MQFIDVCDVTMKNMCKDSELVLSFREKIELAKLLDRLKVSAIDLPHIENVKVDSLLIKSVASAVKYCAVAVPVIFEEGGAEAVWNAVKEAKRPVMQVECPVSAVQMEYFHHKKPEAMLEIVRKAVTECRRYCPEVEFVAQDAARSEKGFLADIINAAVEAGANAVTVCLSSGSMLPDEFGGFIKELTETVPSLSGVRLGVYCSNELAMADACAVEAIKYGACAVKAVSCGCGAVSLQNIVKILSSRGDAMGKGVGVKVTEINRVVSQIALMCRSDRSRTSPFENGVMDKDEAVLSAADDVEQLSRVLARGGYQLSDEDISEVFKAVGEIFAHKDRVTVKELDAIVAVRAMQVPPTYVLDSYVINSGNVISATSHLRLLKNGELLEGFCMGDGPIDASFLAIEQIVGRHYELDDFQIRAVTEGREAMGESVVKLRSGGKIYSGRGISTDIIGSGISAYINALNKIVYEEAEA